MPLPTLNFFARAAAAAVLLGAMSSHVIAAEPREFRADYELYRNGKLMGASTITLSKVRSGYQFRTESASEGGMIGLLGGAKIAEVSDFSIGDQGYLPERYSYKQSVSLKRRKREITFDWKQKWAREDDGDAVVSYLLPEGALDRNLVVLALAEDLRNGVESLNHVVAYKGEASNWEFKNSGVEQVRTAAGLIAATRVERIRENKERSTISWHAQKYDFLPIKIEQREPDGESLEMRLKSISLK